MASRVIPWAFLALATYLLTTFVIGHGLAQWQIAAPVLWIASAFVGVIWASILAATVSTLRDTALGPLVAPLLGTRGVVALGVVVIVVTAVLVYDSRRPPVAEAFAGPYRDPAPYVMFLARPGYTAATPNDPMSHGRESGQLSVNSLGFRGPEWPRGPKAANEIRVAVVGGSLVFLGLRDDRTIAALLARELAQRLGGTSVTPLNAGIVSANSTQELVLFQVTLVDHDPDVVVVLDGFNDIFIPLFAEQRVGHPYNFSVVEAAWQAYVGSGSVLDAAISRSRFLQTLRARLGGGPVSPYDRPQLANAAEPVLRELPGAAAELYLANWRKMARLCGSARIDCLFALQPTSVHRRTPVGGERVAWPQQAIAAARSFYERVEREIRDAPKAFEGATAVSLAGMFEATASQVYLDNDPVHVFDEGNAEIARRLADALCSAAPRLRGRCR